MNPVPALRRGVLALLLLAAAFSASGCAVQSVAVYRREKLVDRIMSFEAQSKKEARLSKSFDAREGSTGGTGGAGGGCACN